MRIVIDYSTLHILFLFKVYAIVLQLSNMFVWQGIYTCIVYTV